MSEGTASEPSWRPREVYYIPGCRAVKWIMTWAMDDKQVGLWTQVPLPLFVSVNSRSVDIAYSTAVAVCLPA